MHSHIASRRLTAAAGAAFLVAVAAACAAHVESGPARADQPAPTHMMAYEFFGVNGKPKGYPKVAIADAAKWLSWAESDTTDSIALHAAGIKVNFYMLPNRIASEDRHFYSEDESLYAHDCSGQRIRVVKKTITNLRYLTDPTSPLLLQRYKAYVDEVMRDGKFDAIYEDTTASLGSLSAMPCNLDPDKWQADHARMTASLGVPVLINGLGDGDLPHEGKGLHATFSMSRTVAGVVKAAPNVIGGSFEGCYVTDDRLITQNDDYVTWGTYWQQTENTELLMARLGKIFICNEKTHEAPTFEDSVAARTYAEASVLLSYGLTSTMVRQNFVAPSKFDVGPELEIVAMAPTSPAPETVDGLRTSTGAYGREYASCYIAGKAVGPCAAAVNSDRDVAHRFPFAGYAHTLVLTGSGILDGGSISADGPAPPRDIEPMTAVVAFH